MPPDPAMTAIPVDDYPARVGACLGGLGISEEAIRRRALPLQVEAVELEVVAVGENGREHRLVPAAARAWQEMHRAAAADDVSLIVVSAFRSLERQAEIVRGKLAAGLPVDTIFCASAPPGYSEHHTGRALDIATPGVEPLEEAFDATEAFAWLAANAVPFGFTLSYPRGNRHGFMYEPWHWFYGPGLALPGKIP